MTLTWYVPSQVKPFAYRITRRSTTGAMGMLVHDEDAH